MPPGEHKMARSFIDMLEGLLSEDITTRRDKIS